MSGSGDIWVDPSIGGEGTEWVDACPPSIRLEAFDIGGELPDNSDDGVPEARVFDCEVDDDECWDGEDWLGEAVGPGEVISAEEASRILSDILIDKFNRGSMYATDICKMCYWMKLGGMIGAVTELARRPGLHPSRYSTHIKKKIGLTGEEETLQRIAIPSSDTNDGSRQAYMLPVPPLWCV